MKVVQLGPYPPPHGGVQTNLVAIRELLRRNGISCAVINLTRSRHCGADGVYYPKNVFQVLRLLLRLRCDVIHIHIGGNLSPRLVGLCLACSLVPCAKTVLTFHSGGYPSSPAGRSARPASLRGFVFRRLDRVIAVNQEISDLFLRLGLPPGKIRVIPPFVLASEPEATDLSEPMRQFLERHQPVVSTVGLLEPEYDLPLQIEVLDAVRRRFPNAGLVIIGAGRMEAELRDLIASRPYAEHILLCGDVPHAATLRVIAESTLFLRTTRYDGDSIAVREALHFGVPVIATDNGMRPAGVHLIPAADSAALHEAIEYLLGACGPAVTRSAEAGDRNVEAVLELYRKLVAGRLAGVYCE